MVEMINANNFKNKIMVEITKEEKEGYVLNKYKNINTYSHKQNRKGKRLALLKLGCQSKDKVKFSGGNNEK